MAQGDVLREWIDPAGYRRCLVEVSKDEAQELKFRPNVDHKAGARAEIVKLLASRAEQAKPVPRLKYATLDGTVYYADELTPTHVTEVTRAVVLDPGDRIKAATAEPVEGVLDVG